MRLHEYARAELGRPWPALPMDRAVFGGSYEAVGALGGTIEFRDPEPLLDIVATEFARGISVRVQYDPRGGIKGLRVTEGWRPCNLPVLREWIMLYNLTQSWDHVNIADLDRTTS